MPILFEFLKSILFGIIQGVTEWLPISSTGHLLVAEELFPLTFSPAFRDMFIVVIQLGSILAVLVLFFERLNPFSSQKSAEEKSSTYRLWSKVLVAALPAILAGLLLDDWIDSIYNASSFLKITTISVALVFYGLVFLWVERKERFARINSLSAIDYRTALTIGLFQVLALVPGTSRSGATILGATTVGTSRVVAAEFSFFLAIPMMFGASGLKLLKFFSKDVPFGILDLLVLLVGTVVAFVVSIFVIKFLLSYLKQNDFKIFGYYRIFAGILFFTYFFFNRS